MVFSFSLSYGRLGSLLSNKLCLMIMDKSFKFVFDTISCNVVGRALVAFKTREAAERVCKKLADGCLMVSNQRYLYSRLF